MSYAHNFEEEKREAKPKAEKLEAQLAELGVEHDVIDWQRAGMLTTVESNGVHIGNLISLGEKDTDALLDEVRSAFPTALARTALSIQQAGGHFIYRREVIAPSQSTASWMSEISFDGDEHRYALVGEYIEPVPSALGWRRVYRLYQAKTNTYCDVQNCKSNWYERKETANGYCVHLCQQHEMESPDRVYIQLQRKTQE